MAEAPIGKSVDPGPIMELTTAYWGSETLFTANRLGLFDALADGAMTIEELSSALGTSPRETGLLARACAGLGLLTIDDAGQVANTPASDAFLVTGRPTYMGNAIRYGDDMYGVWGRLDEAVREGHHILPPADYLGRDPERTRNFVHGMHDRALGLGMALTARFDLAGRHRLFDIGGGPGTCSALFVQRNPGLEAQVLDLPPIVALAEEILSDMGVSDRVSTLAGDYHDAAFPDGNDVVLISGVFHRENEAACRRLIERAYDCLEPGGLLLISDIFTDAGGKSPAFAALFGLNMLLSAPDGGVHADSDVVAWLEASGFVDVDVTHLTPLPHRVVSGRRP